MAAAIAVPFTAYELQAASAAAGESCFEPKQRYLVQLIPYQDMIFRLKAPIEISLYPENGIWICESEAIHSSVHGDKMGDALNAFCEDFAILWDEIANAPDDSLAPDTQRFKATLRSLVRAVEKVR
jgi:hypothetical protein